MVDAWVLRAMHRRCNYDRRHIEYVSECLEAELNTRRLFGQPENPEEFLTPKVAYYLEQHRRSTLADAVILPHLDQATVTCLSQEHLEAIHKMVQGMLRHKPFELVTIHDDYKAHPNNCNQVRWQYREIMAEIAESNLLDDLLSQLYEEPVTFNKLSFNLPEQIREGAYALG
mgnify:FL=1